VPTPGVTAAVHGVVFYDENASGALEPDEVVRLPGVAVRVGGRTGSTDAEGRFVVDGVPGGTTAAEVVAATLPGYFAFAAGPTVSVPPAEGFELRLGARLDIGGNQPNVYMAFGDSITAGDGSRGRQGYRRSLEARLAEHFGRARVVNQGTQGTDSARGLDRLPASLASEAPAFTLILYGTNDWNGFGCRTICGTAENLRRMARACRAAGSFPVVATLPPANPAYESRLASARNDWIVATNAEIRAMAAAEGLALADVHAAFVAEDPGFEPLFSDHVHPNDRGYEAMADAFFRALATPRPGR
jgi:acyl-CoA thioesterase-1